MTQPRDQEDRSKLETRVDRIEQILPTLATKDNLDAAIEPLATKATLRAAIEPLATKDALRESEERTRRHMTIGFEAVRDDIRLVAEGLADLSGKVDRNYAELKSELASHGRRITRLEADQPKR